MTSVLIKPHICITNHHRFHSKHKKTRKLYGGELEHALQMLEDNDPKTECNRLNTGGNACKTNG